MKEKTKNILKTKKGITLIALVVTIVVLLILAAVSISMLGGENGIITQAQKSKDETEQAKVEEIVNVVIGSLIAENQGDTSGITPKDIADKINSEYEQYKNVYAENETSFPTKIIFPEEGDREVDTDLNKNSNNIYNADVSEEDIAPVDIFKYEIISDAETGATTLDSLPTKEARITGIKEKYCNSGGYTTDTGEKYESTNYEITLEDGTKITDTLVVPYQVEIDGEMYKITEANVNIYWKGGAEEYTLPNVKKIIYPNTIKKINSNSQGFSQNSKIEEIILPKNLEVINDYAFYNCKNLTSIEIPSTVISIGASAFSGCSSLTSIEIPDNITSIENNAFYGCSSLTSIEIPNSVTSIGIAAFAGCDGMTSVEIPSSVISIGDSAFSGCSSLTNIEIPSSVTSIGNSAFSRCSSLTSIEIPSGITNIGDSSFSGCSSLTNIEIPNSVTSIGESAFSDCDGLTSIRIPENVTSIADYAFRGCKSLISIVIPSNVINIGYMVFESCVSLTEIKVDENNKKYDSRDNCNAIIESDTNTLLYGSNNMIIPNGVIAIGKFAFGGYSNMNKIGIPSSVINIDHDAFISCDNLKIVNYTGTMAQWKEINIGWIENDDLTNAQIICTDGTLNP